jgi:hypothetical protein
MARIVLEHIRHRYGGASADESGYALKQLHHAWGDGGA